MANHYLIQHYKGRYRIKGEIDVETCDFPRDLQGNIDESYSDLYIDCQSNNKIYYYGKGILNAYIPSIGRGRNIKKALDEKNIPYTNYIETDEENGTYGALGHEMNDASYSPSIDLSFGTIYSSDVTLIRKSKNGKPGEKIASINEEEILAKVSNPQQYNDEVIFPDKVKINLEYYHNRTFWGDIRIIIGTIFR